MATKTNHYLIHTKKIFFVLLMILPAAVVLAEEFTPESGIYVEEGPETGVVRTLGDGDIHLFIEDVEEGNPYTIGLTDEQLV